MTGLLTNLLRHGLERLGQVLLAEWQLALSPDFGVLKDNQHPEEHVVSLALTGFRVFLISESKVPALIAMISGAASGS